MRSFVKKNVKYNKEIYELLYSEEDDFKALREALDGPGDLKFVNASYQALLKNDPAGFKLSTTEAGAIFGTKEGTFAFLDDDDKDELEITQKMVAEILTKQAQEKAKSTSAIATEVKPDAKEVITISRLLLLKKALDAAKIRSVYDARTTYVIRMTEDGTEEFMKFGMILNGGLPFSGERGPWDEKKEGAFTAPAKVSYLGFHTYPIVVPIQKGKKISKVKKKGISKATTKKQGIYFCKPEGRWTCVEDTLDQKPDTIKTLLMANCVTKTDKGGLIGIGSGAEERQFNPNSYKKVKVPVTVTNSTTNTVTELNTDKATVTVTVIVKDATTDKITKTATETDLITGRITEKKTVGKGKPKTEKRSNEAIADTLTYPIIERVTDPTTGDTLIVKVKDPRTKASREIRIPLVSSPNENFTEDVREEGEDRFYWKDYIEAKGYGEAKSSLISAEGLYCAYCETCLNDGINLDIEHKVPKSIFPTESLDWDNFVVACKYCNESFKSNQFAALPLIPVDQELQSTTMEDYQFSHGDISFKRQKVTIELATTISFEEVGVSANKYRGLTSTTVVIWNAGTPDKLEIKITVADKVANVTISADITMVALKEGEFNQLITSQEEEGLPAKCIELIKMQPAGTFKNSVSSYFITDIALGTPWKTTTHYDASGTIRLQKKGTKANKKYILRSGSVLNVVNEDTAMIKKANLEIKCERKEGKNTVTIDFNPTDIYKSTIDSSSAILGDNTLTFWSEYYTDKTTKFGYRFNDEYIRTGYANTLKYAKDNIVWPDVKNNKQNSFQVFDYQISEYDASAKPEPYQPLTTLIPLDDINDQTSLRITADEKKGYEIRLIGLGQLSLSDKKEKIRVIASPARDADTKNQLAFKNAVEICGLNKLGAGDSSEEKGGDEDKKDAGRYFNDQRVLRRTKAWLQALKQLKALQRYSAGTAGLSEYYKKSLDLSDSTGFVAELGNWTVSPAVKRTLMLEHKITKSEKKLDDIGVSVSVDGGEKLSVDISYQTSNDRDISGRIKGMEGGTVYFEGAFSNVSDEITEITVEEKRWLISQEGTVSVDQFSEWQAKEKALLQHLDNTDELLFSYVWNNTLDMVRAGGFYSTWVRTFEKYVKEDDLKRFDLDLVSGLEEEAQKNKDDPFQFQGTDVIEILAHLPARDKNEKS